MQDGPVFDYALHPLPPGRVGFRRWRWELWEGTLLLASGWRVTPHDAERALRTAASRRAHERIGLRVLHPGHARAVDRFVPGLPVRLDCGAVACVLVPRGDEQRSAAA